MESRLSSELPDPYILVFRKEDSYYWCSVNRKGVKGRISGPHPTRESVMEVAQFAAESMNGWVVRIDANC